MDRRLIIRYEKNHRDNRKKRKKKILNPKKNLQKNQR